MLLDRVSTVVRACAPGRRPPGGVHTGAITDLSGQDYPERDPDSRLLDLLREDGSLFEIDPRTLNRPPSGPISASSATVRAIRLFRRTG